MKKRLMAFILALVTAFSLLPAAALADGETVTVQLSNPSAYDVAAGAPFEGALDLNGDADGTAATVSVSPGDTAMDAIASALNAAGYAAGSYDAGGYNIAYGGAYLDSVNGLTAGAASTGGFIPPDAWNYYYDGWCGVINDISPAVGFSSIYVSDGDVIRLEYSLDLSVSGTEGYGAANSGDTGFAFSAGTFSSTGSAASYDLALTLTLPASAASVQVTQTPCTKAPVAVYDKNGVSYPLSADIPVADGDTLQIVGGRYEEVFTVGVNLIGADDVDALLENIAAGYTESSGPWNVIDMSAYRAYNSAAEQVTSAAAVQGLIDSAISHAQAAKPNEGSVAKDIVALQSVGIDPDTLYPLGEAVSLFDALDNTAPSSIYNVGYITLHAYRQGGALTAERAAAMFDVIEASKNSEGNYVYTTVYSPSYSASSIDTATATLATVAPFAAAETDAYGVKARAVAIRDAIIDELAAETQSASGSFGNANSDAMAIIGLAAAGINPHTDARFKAEGGASLLDGLLSYALTDLSGFGYLDHTAKNASATEQGFRALVAAAQMQANSETAGYSYDLYDFSKTAAVPGYSSAWTGSPVRFTLIPAAAAVSIEGKTPVAAGVYDLAAGTYSYTASADAYVTKTGSVTVSADDAAKHTVKDLSVSLSSAPAPSSDITVSVAVKMHPAGAADGTYTYKHNASAYTDIASGSVTLTSGATVFDALDAVLTAAGVGYLEKSSGYISAINGVEEYDHGPSSGWLYMVNGTAATTGCRSYALRSNASVVWFYSDDYSKEYGSEQWGGSETPEKPAQLPFTDVDGHWALDAIQYVYNKQLMQGDGDRFDPEGTLSRAMLVTILYRLAGRPEAAVSQPFTDVTAGQWYTSAVIWAYENKLADGYGDGLFGPADRVTREQMAKMLYAYAQYKEYDTTPSGDLTVFADAGEISGWALDAMRWASGEGLMTGRAASAILPCGDATRAETAAILMRYMEGAAK